MLLPPKIATGVADGSVTLAFRRWPRPDVQVGAAFTTSAGVVRVEAVDVVDAAAITDEQAQAAGWADAERLRRRLRDPDEVDPALRTYRVRLSYAGPDPRIALRESADLTAQDVAALDARLDRLDRASSWGPWTRPTLELIGRRPHVRAPDLATEVGRERDPFTLDVRKLKALGLTVSFDVGYDLSRRGRASLAASTRGRPPA